MIRQQLHPESVIVIYQKSQSIIFLKKKIKQPNQDSYEKDSNVRPRMLNYFFYSEEEKRHSLLKLTSYEFETRKPYLMK